MIIIFRLYGELINLSLMAAKINWDDKSILSLDPRTMEIELQVQKILELQQIANNLLDVFTDCKGVTKFLNPVVNVSCQVDVPI